MKIGKATTMILFGISGDLSRRKILPALESLHKRDLLPSNFHLIGISRKDISIAGLNLNSEFEEKCEMRKMDVNDIKEYFKLNDKVGELSGGKDTDAIFYLSVPPETLPNLIKNIGETKMENVQTKILFEKPFGTSFESAKKLIEETKKYFDDKEVYHIDHYLAKQIISDIAKWQRPKDVRKIEILSLESLGVEGRTQFYEETGALRDLTQSHLLEILAILIKDPHEKREDALLKLTIDMYSIKRGQYKGYREEVGNSASMTETFAEVTYYSKDERWKDIPLTLITGKGFDRKQLKINITTKDSATSIDQDRSAADPGQIFDYERLIHEALKGDKDLFLGNDEILATWKLIDPIIEKWSLSNDDLFIYDKGSTYEAYENSKDK